MGQSMQLVLDEVSCFPDGHSVQNIRAAVSSLPVSHSMQLVDLWVLLGWYWPAAHSMHDSLPEDGW